LELSSGANITWRAADDPFSIEMERILSQKGYFKLYI
jgi:hypothetical protein